MGRPLLLVLFTALTVSQLAHAGRTPPRLAEACGSTSGVKAQSMWLTTSDEVRLYAIETGRGATTVVLAHEGGGSLCGWLPYVKTLVAAHLRVLAFDFRGWGNSASPARHRLAYRNDFAAAVARSRKDGAEHVFLVGASMGGAAVVQNSSRIAVTGRVSLSGTRLWAGYGINDPAGVRRLRQPFLYVGTKNDSRAPLREARSIFRNVGAHDKRQVFYSGSWHGWELVEDAPFANRLRALILAWIRSRS
jgi:pimeloyl-ACP methyl ester carboxylesterase